MPLAKIFPVQICGLIFETIASRLFTPRSVASRVPWRALPWQP